ncbi:MAG: hypothetical protein FJ042_07145 [Candidatus Cloacimonetes bacterium]|nr:hypothetical protein [Candidatus Cloacimonadota bacterium]
MKNRTKAKRKLKDLFWEYRLSERKLQDRLAKNDLADPITVSLYSRLLLSTPDWYEIYELLTPEQLMAALSDQVIGTIHSKAMQERFRFAGSRLLPSR